MNKLPLALFVCCCLALIHITSSQITFSREWVRGKYGHEKEDDDQLPMRNARAPSYFVNRGAGGSRNLNRLKKEFLDYKITRPAFEPDTVKEEFYPFYPKFSYVPIVD